MRYMLYEREEGLDHPRSWHITSPLILRLDSLISSEVGFLLFLYLNKYIQESWFSS